MLPDVHFLPPRCPECSGPMRLVSVVCSRIHVVCPPVQTFECAECETDAIFQGEPAL
jgi:transposase